MAVTIGNPVKWLGVGAVNWGRAGGPAKGCFGSVSFGPVRAHIVIYLTTVIQLGTRYYVTERAEWVTKSKQL